MQMEVGFQYITLQFFSSLNLGLSFLVGLPGSALAVQPLEARVPQGLVLAPVLYPPSSFGNLILFCLYIVSVCWQHLRLFLQLGSVPCNPDNIVNTFLNPYLNIS